MPDPFPPSQEDTSLQQTTTGDRNQTIGQVLAGGTVVYVSGGQVIFNPTSTTAQAKQDTSTKIGPNPYKGLLAFHETDSGYYFGRSREVQILWDKWRTLGEQSEVIRLLPIYGASGSGKSSLMRAGLIPELDKHPLPGRDRARVAILKPGTDPVQALAAILARIAENDLTPVKKTREFAEELKLATSEGEYDGLHRIASLLPDIATFPLVVAVDQFEEVYSLCKDSQTRNTFIANLLHAAGDRARYVSVMLTMRSDFLGENQKYPELDHVFSKQGFLVPAMDNAELEEAIAKPAELAGHPLDAATVDLLLKDTEGREGALPLLQFALDRIWEGLRQGVEPAVTLEQIGGVGGALAGEAQRIYDSLSSDEQAIARRIFLGLVQLGEGTRDTRRRAAVENLVSHKNDRVQVQQVLARFTDAGARLITCSASGDRTEAEVTHEALFDHWQALNQWLDQSRDELRFQRRLEEATTYWNAQGRPEGLLWRSPDLDLLRSFAQSAHSDMTRLSVEFFEAANQAEQQEKQRKAQVEQLRRWTFRGAIAGLLVTTALSSFAGYKIHQAERRQMLFYEATAQSLASDNEVESLVHGLAAIGLGRSAFVKLPNVRREGLVTTRVLDRPNRSRQFRVIAGYGDWVNSVAISANGQTIVSGGDDGTVRLWDTKGNPIAAPFEGHRDSVLSVAISTNGQTIVSGGDDGTVRLWDTKGNLLATPFEGHRGWVSSVAISTDGQTIVSGGHDGTVRLWDTKGNPIAPPLEGHRGWVNSVAISTDGQTIVSGGEDGTVRLWPLWLARGGWISYTCKSLRGYLLVRSDIDEVAREARRTCERYAWKD